jgi:hypothetical protein
MLRSFCSSKEGQGDLDGLETQAEAILAYGTPGLSRILTPVQHLGLGVC